MQQLLNTLLLNGAVMQSWAAGANSQKVLGHKSRSALAGADTHGLVSRCVFLFITFECSEPIS